MEHDAHPGAAQGEVPPSTPEFGAVPSTPFEPLPERLVLSSEEHAHLSAGSVAALAGEFDGDLRSGSLVVERVRPGDVHVRANVWRLGFAPVQLDATVRESWLARASGDRAAVVAGLFGLAQLPRQSTVSVRIHND